MLWAFVLGVLSGAVGLAGLLLSNGLLAMGWPWVGEIAAIFVAGGLAGLGSTAREPGSPAPVLGASLVTGLLAWWAAGPNPSLMVEFGIDRFLLLPQQGALLAGPPAWERNAGVLLVALVAALAGGAASWLMRGRRPLLVRVVLSLVVVSFVLAAAHMNPVIHAETAKPPVPHQYTVDGFLWLRLHDLMQGGQGFYPSFHAAYVERKGETGTPGNWLNWRPPVVFFLWKVVPGGAQGLLVAFWGLAVGAMLAAFGAARSQVDEGFALWAPVLLGAYFLYGADTVWFTSQEYWGSCFMLVGAWAFTRGLPATGVALWALAATTREHFGFLMPLLVALAVLWPRGDRWPTVLALALVGLVYGVHYSFVADYVTPGNPGIHAWREAGGEWVYHCLQFGTVYVALRDFVLMPLLVAGAVGALMVGDPRHRAMFAGMVFLPLVALLFIGGAQRFYWGVVLAPQMLVCVPLVLARVHGCGATQDVAEGSEQARLGEDAGGVAEAGAEGLTRGS